MARKEKNIHYIYKTTCNVTRKYYVGMHSSISLTDSYMGSGKRLRYSIRKYGVDNHTKEILGVYETRELLIEAEIKAITPDMLKDENCLNIVEGGSGFSSEYARECVKLSNEKQKVLRETDADWVKKVKENQSETQKDKYKKGRLKVIPDWNGRNHSDETKEQISQRMKEFGKGEANSQYGTCWITKDGLNKKIKKEEITQWANDGWEKGRNV